MAQAAERGFLRDSVTGALVVTGGGASAPLTLTGSTDVAQLTVKGVAGQTANPFEVRQSDDQFSFRVTAAGDALVRAQLQAQYVFSGGYLASSYSTAEECRLGNMGPASEAGLTLGTAQDTRLYRKSAGVLGSPNAVAITGSADVVQFSVKGNATQTSPGTPIFDVQLSSGNSVLHVDSSQRVFINDGSRAGNTGLRIDTTDAANTIYNFGGQMGFNTGSGVLQLTGNAGVRLVGNLGFFNLTTPIAKQTVTGSKGANAALTSLMTALAAYGLVTDSTT